MNDFLVANTNIKDTNMRLRLSILAVATLVLSARGADLTWTGGAADANWTSAGNWGGTAPVAFDSLFFAGSTRLNMPPRSWARLRVDRCSPSSTSCAEVRSPCCVDAASNTASRDHRAGLGMAAG